MSERVGINWERFRQLRYKPLVDCSIDTTAINAKYAKLRENGLRWHEGTFRLPKGLQKDTLRKALMEAGWKFIASREKQGWDFTDQMDIQGPVAARDMVSGAVVTDEDEYTFRGVFKTVPKPLRTEIPIGLVKQDPEHIVSVQEALRAE